MQERATIVVIEDSDELREFMAFALQSDGHRVVGCADADAGFAAIRSDRPELVITDMMLGVTSGLELITRIRSDLTPPVPTIIACSGFPDYEQDALKRGAETFLSKPFDLGSLREAVRHALTRRPLPAQFVEDANRQSRELRRCAIVAAEEARVRMEPRDEDLRRRAEWTLRWLPEYIGFGQAAYLLIRGTVLSTELSTDEALFPPTAAVDERFPFCRDIVESSSSIVLPDVSAYPCSSTSASRQRVRFFAGVPVFAGVKVAIGAVCLFDDQPHTLDAEDLELLAGLGRRASAILGGSEPEVIGPFWEPSGLVSRDGLELLLGCELRRAQREATSVSVLLFEPLDGDAMPTWTAEVARATSPRRRALVDLGAGRFGLLLVRAQQAAGERELAVAMSLVRRRAGLRGGGLVSLEGTPPPVFSQRDLMQFAEALLSREARAGRGEIERVLIRHEDWWDEAASPHA